MASVGPVFALSIHADYRCRHSGVCCSSDWDVPVELPIYRNLADALTSGRVQPYSPPDGTDDREARQGLLVDQASLITGDDLPEDAAAMLARNAAGDCVFLDRGARRCVVHRDLGEPALPATCRHFPRLAVHDRRGTFVSLTHYCPTAASMLFRDDVALAIVESPPAFPPADYEGLEVEDDAWPPLLHPTMLMEFADYAAWERHMVARCAEPEATPEGIVATLERDAEVLRTFVPGGGSVADCIAALPPGRVERHPPSRLDASLLDHVSVMAAVPEDLKPSADDEGLEDAYARHVADAWPRWSAPLTRYLAAKAFANWTAYQGRGVLSIVRGLDAALSLVRVEAARGCRDAGAPLDGDILREAIRRADFALNHLAVGEDLADAWSLVEND